MTTAAQIETTDLKDNFRNAMRRMAASVSIVTVAHGGHKAGATVSSVTSVSFDPMSLLVCIHNQSLFHDIISKADHFCINLLRADQEDLSNTFSRPSSEEDLFSKGDWQDLHGHPYLKNAQANFFLKKQEAFAFGSHTIFIGEVREVICAEEVSPLVYMDGGYVTPQKK